MEQKGESSAETVGQSLPGCCNTGHTKVGRITLRGQRELIPLRLTIDGRAPRLAGNPTSFPHHGQFSSATCHLAPNEGVRINTRDYRGLSSLDGGGSIRAWM